MRGSFNDAGGDLGGLAAAMPSIADRMKFILMTRLKVSLTRRVGGIITHPFIPDSFSAQC